MSVDAPRAHLTVEDVAARHQVTTTTVRRWIKSGKLRALRATGGGRLRVTVEDLAAFEQQQGTIPAQDTTPPTTPEPEAEEWSGYTDAAALGESG